MVLSIVPDKCHYFLYILKGESMGGAAFSISMYPWYKPIFSAALPEGLENPTLDVVEEEEGGMADLQALVKIGHFGVLALLFSVSVSCRIDGHLTGVGKAHYLTHQDQVQLCLGQLGTP